ncbi:sushi, von Willebrand factor type A, EGF and pentraxin domain-containing protein 1-like isoform X2 [Anneissia japonica]|uniref:sushi, von Willebrand factor type A, EGF and pentraxin domain-containing protein 1-like isoform X2 n=1 Tax=Anneissia japonica TaxID=1529436 RepID=UPI00142597A1|nr:sushi, von Willebrand factor type A, EGF and pentraxin domain-containing protein 1-like isoform X2 [Anneissia japonica]
MVNVSKAIFLEQQNSSIKNDPHSDSFDLEMANTKSLGTLYYLCIVILYFSPMSYSQGEDVCGFPGIKSNGNTQPFKASYAIGEIVTFSCYSNYVIVGQANLTCQGGDTWDAETPECVKICPELSFPDTQVISRNVTLEGINVIGDILVWECKDGYSIDSGQANDQTVTICKPEGWFTESVITCSKISCTDPGIPIGVQRDGDSFEFADVVTYTCSNMGDVISSGSSSRTCQANSTWSGSSPVCTAIDCMDPGQHNLTTRTGDTFSYGAVLLYECVSSASQVSGSVSIECQLDGTWSGEPLVCQYPTTHIITTMMMQTTDPHLTSTEDNTVAITEPPIVTEVQTSSNFSNSLSPGKTASNTASTRSTSSPNTKKSDQETITLSSKESTNANQNC